MTPEEFTRWQIDEMKKKKRKQITLVICIMIGVPILLAIANMETEPSDEERYESGMRLFNEAQYSAASAKFSKITPAFAKYSEVKSLLKTSDSLADVTLKAKKDAEAKEKIATLKTSLAKEIDSDVFKKNGFNGSYRGDIQSLQLELVVFGAWKVMIDEAEDYDDDPELKKLAQTLRKKVVALQKKEFPLLRKEYANLLGNVLWENDVEVQVKGSRNTTLEFTGGMFAANRNIKESQEALHEQLKMFRFKRTEYKWMEYADEYTYYDISSSPDDALYTP